MIDKKTLENINVFYNGLKNKKIIKYNEIFIKKLLFSHLTELYLREKPEEIDQSLIEKSDIIIINFKEKFLGELKNKIIYKSNFVDNENFFEQTNCEIRKYYNLYRNNDYGISKIPIITIGYAISERILIINLQEIDYIDVDNNSHLYISKTEFNRQLEEKKKLEEEKEKILKEKLQKLKMVNQKNFKPTMIKKSSTYIDDGFAGKIIYDKYLDIYHLDYYYTKKIYDEDIHEKVINKDFNKYSQDILYLKKSTINNYIIRYFSDKLTYVLEEEFNNGYKIPDYITCVPSHQAYKINENMNRVINNLCYKFGSQNACGGLQRTKTIVKLAYGGRRDKEVHLNSININNNILKVNTEEINKIVYVMDDITTTGHTLNACKEMLEGAGYIVRCIALGKTRN